ncbi:aminotransferase class IV [Aquimarina sp. ERC-38]|uniref:aminotransferase class IV n=1 Tax=Aquimarina sp. ERC-38 TaxID=2949996 RepID=UPI0022461942|nr:aminotransferase class IV [Aquimarina sp. ERC-38]UZO80182.1 aminotransferase class IV [Aquimarina sp. ERC-38]
MKYISQNGTHQPINQAGLSVYNRGYQYGDAVFETIKVKHQLILFWEDHYLRLMASMRIMRMEIPMNFTMEYLQEKIVELIAINDLADKVNRVKIIVHRSEGGLYTPKQRGVEFIIFAEEIEELFTIKENHSYEVGLYKDHYVTPDLLSTLKSNNRLINVLGSIFAEENNFKNCLLLNTNKMAIESLNANIFMVNGTTISTPPLTDGCLNGIMRLQILKLLKKNSDYAIEETSISPFQLQKADELFLTNTISGIIPITKYKKKEYITKTSLQLQKLLQQEIKKMGINGNLME